MSTELASERFRNIDEWSVESAVEAMIEGQLSAIASIKPMSDNLAKAASAAAERLSNQGRLIYVGAGTSGRVATQDGVELYPTYGWPNERLVYILAGGESALVESVEGAEDDSKAASSEIMKLNITPNDVVIGVAASGKTPFTIAALKTAQDLGALTIGIVNNENAPLMEVSDFGMVASTGSELIAGSTRMKAGTAQKVILNILSTSIMLSMGKVHRGLMVNMVISNKKLRQRGAEIVKMISGASIDQSRDAIIAADDNLPLAILMGFGLEKKNAADLLNDNSGHLGASIATLGA